jgi:hypothetical protein
MGNDPVTKSGAVGGYTVDCTPFYARGTGMALAAEALDIAGPALAKLAGTVKKDVLIDAAGALPTGQLFTALLAELGVDGIIAELLGVVRRLYVDDPAKGDRFVARLLSQTTVTVGQAPVMLNTPEHVDMVVGCNLLLLLGLCRFALEVNFAGFFGGLSSIRPAASAPVARTG